MWFAAVVLASVIATPPDVTVARLDGSMLSGKLQSWTGDKMIVIADDRHELAAAEIVSLQFRDQQSADNGQQFVETVDGLVLPIKSATATADRLSVELNTPSPGKPQTLELPLARIQTLRLLPIDPRLLPHWNEIASIDSPSDVLVVLQRDGKSLDYLEGIVGNVSAEKVEFTVDDQKVEVPRSKVAGIMLFRTDKSTNDRTACALTGAGGLRVPAQEVQLDGDILHIIVPHDIKFDWPLSDISSADYSAGKLLYLSDLEPLALNWEPLIGLPASAKRAANFGRARFNQAADGGPLLLGFPQDELTGAARVEQFSKGLALRSRTELIFRLPEGYSRLLAIAGIDPAMASSGHVRLSIHGDERALAELAIDGAQPPAPLDVEISDAKRLRIVVDYGDNLDTGDWLNLCNARIVK